MGVTISVDGASTGYVVLLPTKPALALADLPWPAIDAWLAACAAPEVREAVRALRLDPRLTWQAQQRRGFALLPWLADRRFASDGLPPDGLLQMLGMTAHERARKRAARSRVVVGIAAAPSPAWLPQRAVRWLAFAVAALEDGVVYEPAAMSFARPRVEYGFGDGERVRMQDQLAVPTSDTPLGVQITTLGMPRFGLPNLTMSGVPGGQAGAAGRVVNAVAAALVHLAERYDHGTFTVGALPLTRRDFGGDDDGVVTAVELSHTPFGDETMLGIAPVGGADLAAWLEGVAARAPVLVPVLQADVDDPELAAAEAEARATLPGVKGRFYGRPIPKETLSVKTGFPTPDGGVEHMWVAVDRWEGDRLVGTLANDPEQIPSLKCGDRAEVAEADLEDWIVSEGGGMEGAFTVKVLMARG